MSLRRLTTLLTLALAAIIAPAGAHAGLPTGDGNGGFSLTPIGDFEAPIDADDAPGFPGAMFVAEKRGRILVVRNGVTRTALDLRGRVADGGEQGLLAIAFHPRYRRNRLLYVYITGTDGDNRLMEFRGRRRAPLLAKRSSGRVLLRTGHLFAGNHNGGGLQFGPDRLLYLSTGDGGGGGDQFGQAQNRASLLGKLLRLDPRRVKRCGKGKRGRRRATRRGLRCGRRARRYTAPRGNPFRGEPGRNEIYSLGLRNPFRFSFDSGTGAIAIGDVGEGCVEEIDYRRRGRARGANFGWARFEGSQLFDASRSAPGAIGPIHEYNNPAQSLPPGGCPDLGGFEGSSVIAGFVVRDRSIGEQFGRLLYGDASNNEIRSLIPAEAGASGDGYTGVSLPSGTPFSFAEGAGRRVYVVSGAGPVYRLDPA